ncbi:hypothetical protein SHO565_52720 [Streptomyces sp. HO565]
MRHCSLLRRRPALTVPRLAGSVPAACEGVDAGDQLRVVGSQVVAGAGRRLRCGQAWPARADRVPQRRLEGPAPCAGRCRGGGQQQLPGGAAAGAGPYLPLEESS